MSSSIMHLLPALCFSLIVISSVAFPWRQVKELGGTESVTSGRRLLNARHRLNINANVIRAGWNRYFQLDCCNCSNGRCFKKEWKKISPTFFQVLPVQGASEIPSLPCELLPDHSVEWDQFCKEQSCLPKSGSFRAQFSHLVQWHDSAQPYLHKLCYNYNGGGCACHTMKVSS